MRFQRFKKIVIIPAVLLFLFSLEGVLFAEDLSRETQAMQRETYGERRTAVVAEKSEETAIEKKFKTGVTYEDVLKDPDNIDLNFRYAKQQIAKGELLGASATLERMILINPNLADVRLLYGVVLYRLDSLNEAQKELEMLKTVSLPPKIRSDVNLYLKKIKSRKRRTHIALRETLGWGYDTNRNASPSSKYQWLTEIPLQTTGTNVRLHDTHFLNVTSVDVTHDLGFQAGHSLFGSFTYYLQEQTQVDSLDLASFQYELGGTYKTKWVNFTPSFYMSNVTLSRETFLRTQGGSFLFDHNFGKKLNVFYNFRIERQDYSNIWEDNNAYNRKGSEADNYWGFSYILLPTMRWSTTLGYGHKSAKQDYYAYSRLSLTNTHTWILPKGMFLINTVSAYFDNYDAPDFTVAWRHRRDKSMRYRVTYGIPLTTLMLGKILPGPLRDTVFTFSYEYYRAHSNITNYSYHNNKIQALLGFRFEY